MLLVVGCRYRSRRASSTCFLGCSHMCLSSPNPGLLTCQVGFLPWIWAVNFHLFPRALICFPGGCLGPRPCSPRAGHLSHKCFLAPCVREAVLGDVAEILCLRFLFLFLLAPPLARPVCCGLGEPCAPCFGPYLSFILYKSGKGCFFNSWC